MLLEDAETVLFVDDGKAQSSKRYSFREESVRPYNNGYFAGFKTGVYLFFFFDAERAGQQGARNSKSSKNR